MCIHPPLYTLDANLDLELALTPINNQSINTYTPTTNTPHLLYSVPKTRGRGWS